MENLSDTYHDPSHRVPGIFYWNADPPLKKNEHFQKFRGGFMIRQPTLSPIFRQAHVVNKKQLTTGRLTFWY